MQTCLLIVYSQKRFPTVRRSRSRLQPSSPAHQLGFCRTTSLPCSRTSTSDVFTSPVDRPLTLSVSSVLNKPYEGKIVEFALWDTAGQEEYDRLRPLSYPETHVLFVCFAVDYPVSLENVEDKVCSPSALACLRGDLNSGHRTQWYPEVAHFCEDVPIILVATKTDLRADSTAVSLLKAQGRHPVTPEEGAAVAKRIGAKYAEVSAMTGRGVEEVFDLALREAMKGTSLIGRSIKRRKAKCTVL